MFTILETYETPFIVLIFLLHRFPLQFPYIKHVGVISLTSGVSIYVADNGWPLSQQSQGQRLHTRCRRLAVL